MHSISFTIELVVNRVRRLPPPLGVGGPEAADTVDSTCFPTAVRLLPLLLTLFLTAPASAQNELPSVEKGAGSRVQRETPREPWVGTVSLIDSAGTVLATYEEIADTAIARTLREWVTEQQSRAYWEASVDQLTYVNSRTAEARAHLGPRYAWRELRAPTDPEAAAWARRAGFRPRRYAPGRRLDYAGWTSLRDSLIVRAADAGYPFASVALDSLEWAAPGALSAVISVTPGPLIRVGELRAPENARVRPVFLQRYLGLIEGETYRQDRVRQLRRNLNQLPYVSLRGEPKITLLDSLAFIDLPLERRSASRFDFVIGVLPNTGPDRSLLITGELNGELYNGFGQGERVAVRFEQLRPQTQELQLAVDYPFLLGLPFGAEAELDLYRRDSSFLNLNWSLAATYLRTGNDKLSVFWENRRTIVPGGNDRQEMPLAATDTAGVSRSFFGIGLQRNRTDRSFSPRSGYVVDVSAAAGLRRLLDQPADSLGARTGQLKLEGTFRAYFDPLAGTVIYLGLHGAGLFQSGEVLANEQYRIGGARLLRGFDEQSVFARDYLVATAEFRLLLGGNAFLYAFLDAGRVNGRSEARPDVEIDYPLGFGVGVNFETRAGIFGLDFALGRSSGIPLDLGAPKVHLGYVSVF